MIVAVIILGIAVISLIVYNVVIHNRVKELSNTNQKISNLNILQDFMNIVGSDMHVDEKLQQINTSLIEKYTIKYSTIVVFNGAEYEIKATNVERKHWDVMKNLQQDEIFKESIVRGTPKYITVEKDTDVLSYQTSELGRAKSAMFFPIYIDNIYIGYWIIESGQKHAFDKIDLKLIDVVKENIIVVLKTMQYQSTLESIVRQDLFSGLNSAEYLYGQGKFKIDKCVSSTLCMFKIANLEEVNKKYNRETGNQLVIEVSNIIKTKLSSEYIFVRYMGPKFEIVFVGETTEEVTAFVNSLKNEIEETEIEVVNTNKKAKQQFIVPKINFVITTYYKGTALENTNKKLEEFLDNAPIEENRISYL